VDHAVANWVIDASRGASRVTTPLDVFCNASANVHNPRTSSPTDGSERQMYDEGDTGRLPRGALQPRFRSGHEPGPFNAVPAEFLGNTIAFMRSCTKRGKSDGR
jgi:hypothetical protein